MFDESDGVASEGGVESYACSCYATSHDQDVELLPGEVLRISLSQGVSPGVSIAVLRRGRECFVGRSLIYWGYWVGLHFPDL